MTRPFTLRRALAAAMLAAPALLAGGAPAFAQAAKPAVGPIVDKGDTTWMIVATMVVMVMTVPGLALFYGGLVRAKNMLSVLTQILAIMCVGCVVWALWGYSLAFTDGSHNALIGGTSKLFLAGVTPTSTSATFSAGFVIPEYIYMAFQMTFAAITAGLVIGSIVERVKFSAILIFSVLWLTLVYAPIAHMVWWAGGYVFALGALDFAGGTVVHINAGVAALVGALFLGKRIGFPEEPMPPHSLVMTLIGVGLVWFGWFGFNAGSNLEANGITALTIVNTFLAPAAAGPAWMLMEWATRGKPSLLGLCSGVVAGLVAVTPAAGLAGPVGAMAIGVAGTVVSYVFVNHVKHALRLDESLDVFGIHGVAGIVGSILTGVVVSPALGGVGVKDYDMAHQVVTQITAVLVAAGWSGIVSALLFFVLDKTIGLRVSRAHELEGLDITSHGERAYHH